MQGTLQLLRLINTLEKVTGRKRFHKIVHILKNTGYEEDFPQYYGYLHYGPFSEDVSYEISSLVKDGLIDEQGSGEAYEAYVYSDTGKSRDLLKKIGQDATPAWSNRARALNQLDTPLLEAISTILFLQRNGFEGERLKTRFGELKPGLKKRFDDALKRARQLKASRS